MLNILGMIILIIILFIIILLLIGIRISLIYDKKGSELKGCLKILIFKKIKVYSHKFPSKDNDDNEEEEKDDYKQRDIKKLIRLAKPCFEDFKIYLKSALNVVSIKKFENAIAAGTCDAQVLAATQGAVDKAASKGVIHKNAANRKKARLAKRLAKEA